MGFKAPDGGIIRNAYSSTTNLETEDTIIAESQLNDDDGINTDKTKDNGDLKDKNA